MIYDDIYPVQRITAGALSGPGQRLFILQAQMAGKTVSWVIAREHALSLGRAIPPFLAKIHAEFPELEAPLIAKDPNLALVEPVDPVFRVASIGLGYDRLHDLVVLTLLDARIEETPLEELLSVEPFEHQIYTTRGQALLLSRRAEDVVAAGRPLCPHCGEPIDDFGHFCPPLVGRYTASLLL